MSQAKPEFNPYLHGLRGVAAFSVVLCHCFTLPRDYGLWPQAVPLWFGELMHMGRYGVEVFFLISGYLITESLRRKNSVRLFLLERSLRLQPAYLGVLLPLFLLKPLISPNFLDGASLASMPLHFLSNLFFLPGVLPLPIALGVGWTLSFEALFYLTASGTFLLAPRFGQALAASFCVMVAMVAAVLYPGVVFFFVGAGVYLYRAPLRALLQNWRWPLLALVAWIGIWNLILWAYADDHQVSAPGMLGMAACLILSLLFFAPTVEGRGLLAAVLRNRVLQYLGSISFSLYLWHSPIIATLAMVLKHKLPPGSLALWLTLVALTIPMALIAAHLSWRICEQWLSNWLRRRLLPKLARPVAVTTP